MFKQNLPNFLTLLNLLAGSTALVFVFNEDYRTAFALVIAGIFFDFFDGLTARLTGTSSAMGLQLDSLADLVTSGLVPSFFLIKIWENAFTNELLHYFPLIIIAASAWRLARFNIDPNQKKHFTGLPTPANALFLLATGMILITEPETSVWHQILSHPWSVIVISLLSAWLLNARLPLLSLKISSGNKKPDIYSVILLAVSITLIAILKFKSAPLILFFYVVLSRIYFKKIARH